MKASKDAGKIRNIFNQNQISFPFGMIRCSGAKINPSIETIAESNLKKILSKRK